jgi:hypothetical protein
MLAAEMKYDTLVMTLVSAHFPRLGSQVAATGRHQVRTATSVTMHAIITRLIVVYRMYLMAGSTVIRRRATQIDDLMKAVLAM